MTEKPLQRVEMRKATPIDALKILGIFKKSHAANMPDFPPVDDNDAVLWILGVIAQGIAVVACVNDRIVGSFGGVLVRHGWNSKEYHLKGEWFCILDKYNDSAIPVAMMKKIKKDAGLHKNNLMFSYYGDKTDTLEKTFLDTGMIPLGRTMLWKAKRDSEESLWVKD